MRILYLVLPSFGFERSSGSSGWRRRRRRNRRRRNEERTKRERERERENEGRKAEKSNKVKEKSKRKVEEGGPSDIPNVCPVLSMKTNWFTDFFTYNSSTSIRSVAERNSNPSSWPVIFPHSRRFYFFVRFPFFSVFFFGLLFYSRLVSLFLLFTSTFLPLKKTPSVSFFCFPCCPHLTWNALKFHLRT